MQVDSWPNFSFRAKSFIITKDFSDVFGDSRVWNLIERGNTYFVRNYHDEDGVFCTLEDLWLISKDWEHNRLLLEQESIQSGGVHWSNNNKYLSVSICWGKDILFDIEKKKKHAIHAYGGIPLWTKDNHLMYFKDGSHLMRMNPKTLKAQKIYDFGEFNIDKHGKCDEACGDAPNYSSFGKEGDVLKINISNTKEEVWEFLFDANGKFVSKKKIGTCAELVCW